MNFLKVICPRCSQSIEAPMEAAGEEVTCPTCAHKFMASAAPARPLMLPREVPQAPVLVSFVSLAFVTAGLCAWGCAHVESDLGDSDRLMLSLAGAAIFGAGAGWLIYKAIRQDAHMAAKGLLAAGLMVLAGCGLLGSVPGILAGGFAAVIGAVLWPRK